MAAEVEHATGLPNGYWVPMTALARAASGVPAHVSPGRAQRVLGTILGAALATLLVRELRPGPADHRSRILTAVFAWLAYALVNVNYGLFAVFLTGYIVFLLDFGGPFHPRRRGAPHA